MIDAEAGGGRHQRMCPEHGRILNGLECPVGPHHVERWKVVDTEKHTALFVAEVDRADAVAVAEKLTPAAPKAARAPARREREKPMEQPDKPADAKTSGVLKKARFTGPAGELLVQLLFRKKGLFQVRWTLKPPSGKKATGLLHQGEDRSQAFDAYGRALVTAKEQAWEEHSAYAAIPSATLGAAARGKPAAPAVAARTGKPGKAAQRCRKCGADGHNARTCSRKRAAA